MSVTVSALTTSKSDKLYELVRDDVVGTLPQVSQEQVYQNLDIILGEFFREGQAWIQELGPYELKTGETIYTCNPLDQLREVVNVRRVSVDSSVLAPVADSGGPFHVAREGKPRYYFCPDPTIIRFVPIPTTDYTDLYILAAMKPSKPRDWVPGFIVDQYFETLIDGVLGRFYRMPSKPWSNLKVAEYHARRFRNRTRLAKDKAERGYNLSSHSWSFPYFGGSERRV